MYRPRSALLLLALLLPRIAWAEGTDQLGTTQALRADVVLYVDILDPSVEQIRWIGVGGVDVFAPDGSALGSYASGALIDPLAGTPGAYRIEPTSAQVIGQRWDVEVVNSVASGGRLYAYDWWFNAGSFDSSAATDGSFYALVPGGGTGESAVIELKLDGLAGYIFDINANSVGVDGPSGGRSVPSAGHSVTPVHAIYLSPPSIASYASSSPTVSNLGYRTGSEVSVTGEPIDDCQELAPGFTGGFFQFESDVVGSYHLQCDLDQDGSFDTVGGNDLLIIGPAGIGENEVWWDGFTAAGTPVAEGLYDCRVRVAVGEFHYVGRDIETSFEGMRLFEVQADGSRRPLTMFWDDSEVQGAALVMPDGNVGLASSGPSGMSAGPYADPAQANVNARSWGSFVSSGKGNESLLDTWTWLRDSTSALLQVSAVDGLVDTDGDGLSDHLERCDYGTDPDNPDTDDDGVPDGEQYGAPPSSSAEDGGLESNGRLASALAARRIARSRLAPLPLHPPQELWAGPGAGDGPWSDTGSWGDAGAGDAEGDDDPSDNEGDIPTENGARFALASPLSELLPLSGPRASRPQDASALDLPQFTNARSVLGADYLNARGQRIGSVLLVETRGERYEHGKALCDRAGGALLASVHAVEVEGWSSIALESVDPRSGARDRALSFDLIEGEDGWRFASAWLDSAYQPPDPDARVIRVQAWAAAEGDERELARAILRRAAPVLSETAAVAPPAWLTAGSVMGGQLELRTTRPRAELSDLALRLRPRNDDGQWGDPLDLPWNERLSITVPPLREAFVEVLHRGELVDRMWLSDGAWAPYHDGLWGVGGSELSFSDCQPAGDADWSALAETLGWDPRTPPARLAGCAQAVGTVDRIGGVARHLGGGQAPVDLSQQGALVLRVAGAGALDVCLEGGSARRCATVGPNEGRTDLPSPRLESAVPGARRWLVLPAWRFEGSERLPEDVELITVSREGAGSLALELSALGWTPWRPDGRPRERLASDPTPVAPSAGCSLTTPVRPLPNGWLLPLLLLLWARSRARPQRRRD